MIERLVEQIESRFDDRGLGPGPPVERYFHRLVEFAQRAGWGRVPSAM